MGFPAKCMGTPECYIDIPIYSVENPTYYAGFPTIDLRIHSLHLDFPLLVSVRSDSIVLPLLSYKDFLSFRLLTCAVCI